MRLRTTLLLTVTLLLAACNSGTNSISSPDSPAPPEDTSALTAELPDIQCQGELPEPLKSSLGEYRLAQESDFVQSIRARASDQQNEREQYICSIFTADFNEDGQKDYALLLVHQETTDFQFRLVLNQGNGQFNPVVTKDYERLSQPSEGVIYTTMTFKSPGEPGPALRMYFPLKPGTPERETFVSKPAIELWAGYGNESFGEAEAASREKNAINVNVIQTLSYCSEIFYFVEDELKKTLVCD